MHATVLLSPTTPPTLAPATHHSDGERRQESPAQCTISGVDPNFFHKPLWAKRQPNNAAVTHAGSRLPASFEPARLAVMHSETWILQPRIQRHQTLTLGKKEA